MPTAVHRKIEMCERGEDPLAIAKLPSGWVCLADIQPLRGYCILFSNPVARDLNDLSLTARGQWGIDCARVGDALLSALGAKRVNYETWGNLDPALHTHITPRYASEDPALGVLPPRQAYDVSRALKIDPLSPEIKELVEKIRRALKD